MHNCLDAWYEYLARSDKKVSLSDSEADFSRSEIEQLSGKIYKYLSDHSIGKDDFVLINLPRSSRIYIAMLGVAKAGAAFVVVESTLSSDRIEYIRKNSNCKCVIDAELFQKIRELDYLKGYKSANDHDAAFAIYTSGTTGTPKGVVHEYGNYGMLYKSILDPQTMTLRENEETRFLNIAPFNFVASVMMFTLWLYSGAAIYTPDYDIIKNSGKLIAYAASHKLNQSFIPPSLLRVIADHLNEEMKLVYTGSELANNVSYKKGDLYNLYLSSETLFVMSQYKITEALDPMPIGRPNPGIELSLSDEGEVICKNPYCRGYMNEDENHAFRDGCYNTGDLAEINEEGEYVLKGRLSDTIKINGNRVEPLEIEITASKILNGIPCAVKGFRENDTASVCLYYECNQDIDENHLRAELEKKLPYYMSPSHIVRLDTLPKTKLGKLDRKALKMPDYVRKTKYVAPETDIQKKLCDVFEKILSVKKPGIDDDLFELGLDSIRVIEAVTELNTQSIQSMDVYRSRTIRNLSKLYDENSQNLTLWEKEQKARETEWPIDTMTGYLFYGQRALGNYTGFNLSAAYKLSKLINLPKLRDAINKVTDESSSFKMMFAQDDNGQFVIKYTPERYKPLEIETMSEEEVDELRKTFVRPMDLLSELPYRIRLVKTKHNAYLFLDVHHAITDGMGMVALGENFVNAYLDKPTKPFHYFAYCYDSYQESHSPHYQKSHDELLRVYSNPALKDFPYSKCDEVYEFTEQHDTLIPIEQVNRFVQEKHLTRNILFLSAEAITLAKLCHSNHVALSWMYANRDVNGNQAGFHARSVMAAPELQKVESISDLYSAVLKEIKNGIEYSDCPGISIPEIQTFNISVDDLIEIEKKSRMPKAIGQEIKLERPFDVKASGVSLQRVLRFINRNGNLAVEFIADNSFMDKNGRTLFLKTLSEAIHRLMDNDETILSDYLNADASD